MLLTNLIKEQGDSPCCRIFQGEGRTLYSKQMPSQKIRKKNTYTYVWFLQNEKAYTGVVFAERLWNLPSWAYSKQRSNLIQDGPAPSRGLDQKPGPEILQRFLTHRHLYLEISDEFHLFPPRCLGFFTGEWQWPRDGRCVPVWAVCQGARSTGAQRTVAALLQEGDLHSLAQPKWGQRGHQSHLPTDCPRGEVWGIPMWQGKCPQQLLVWSTCILIMVKCASQKGIRNLPPWVPARLLGYALRKQKLQKSDPFGWRRIRFSYGLWAPSPMDFWIKEWMSPHPSPPVWRATGML